MINPNAPLARSPYLGGLNFGGGFSPLTSPGLTTGSGLPGDVTALSPEMLGGPQGGFDASALLQALGGGDQQQQLDPKQQKIQELEMQILATEFQLLQAQTSNQAEQVPQLQQQLQQLQGELQALLGGNAQGQTAGSGGGDVMGGISPSGGGGGGGGGNIGGGGGGGNAGGGGGSVDGGGGGGGGTSSVGGGESSNDVGSATAIPSPELSGDDKKLAEAIEKQLAGTPLAGKGLGADFVAAGRKNDVDPLALVAIGKHETGLGKLGVGVRKFMGVGAYDSNPNGKTPFDGARQQIYSGAKTFANLRRKGGSDSKAPMAQQLSAVNRAGWATDKNWHNGVGSAYNSTVSKANKTA